MNFVMVCSMCVTSPLILPFGLLYFLGLWAVWRYQALYVYQRQYESGGQVSGRAGPAGRRRGGCACQQESSEAGRGGWTQRRGSARRGSARWREADPLACAPPPWLAPLQFWPLVAHKVVACQLIMVVFTASVLMFKVGGAHRLEACLVVARQARQAGWWHRGPPTHVCLARRRSA